MRKRCGRIPRFLGVIGVIDCNNGCIRSNPERAGIKQHTVWQMRAVAFLLFCRKKLICSLSHGKFLHTSKDFCFGDLGKREDFLFKPTLSAIEIPFVIK